MEEIKNSVGENQDKVISLFQFIQELNKLRQKIIVNTRDYRWVLPLASLPVEENYITVSYRDRVAEEDFSSGTSLLSVKKPEFDTCPRPPFDLREWLDAGWDDYRNEAQFKEYIIRDYEVTRPEEEEPMLLESQENPSDDIQTEKQEAKQFEVKGPELHFGDETDPSGLTGLPEEESNHPVLTEMSGNEGDTLLLSETAGDEGNSLLIHEMSGNEAATLALPMMSEKEALHRSLVTDAVYPYTEFFDEEEARKEQFDRWNRKRTVWMERQKLLAQINDLFVQLYQLHQDLERDSETLEMVAANGILRDRENPQIDHPVLTRRVKLVYDAQENMIQIVDTDVPSELYSVVFQELQDINRHALASLKEQVKAEDYHPMDRNALPGFLKAMVHKLSAESLYTEGTIPSNWMKENRLLMTLGPVFILRKKLDGTVKAIESIIEQIKTTGYVPDPIRDLVSGGVVEMPEEKLSLSLEEQLAAVGGESLKVLLSKEANKEQLEIASRIEDFNAVLVQGPPGTGKTHTIANLMGHFLAQGKSVLVTAHTAKALDVLKDKMDPGLRSLCVSILDDSNQDMEKSVEGITAYMSQTTASELNHQMIALEQQRRDVIKKLAQVRSNIFDCIKEESSPYIWNGEMTTPSKMAEYVRENREKLSYIPGKVKPDIALPLNYKELEKIYRTNQQLDVGEEKEFAANLPDPVHIPSVDRFASILDQIAQSVKEQERILSDRNWTIREATDDGKPVLTGSFGEFRLNPFDEQDLSELLTLCNGHQQMEDWMLQAAIAGMRGADYAQRWHTLIDQILKTCSCSENSVGILFGKQIYFAQGANLPNLMLAFDQMKQLYLEKGRIPKLTLLTKPSYQEALRSVSINGLPVQSADDCEVVLKYLELFGHRQLCANYWDSLLSPYGVPRFAELDQQEPELVARNWTPRILKYVRWSQEEYNTLVGKLSEIGSFYKDLFETSELDSDQVKLEKIFRAIRGPIADICHYGLENLKARKLEQKLTTIIEILQKDQRSGSELCIHLVQAVRNRDVEAYGKAYEELALVYTKYTTMLDRRVLLNKLSEYAPGWANAIRKRSGIHGDYVVPADIEDAWRWKQYEAIVNRILEKPFAEYQKESLKLGKEYRRITAQYVEASAWYHLLARTEADIDMKQALNGWKQTIKRIGKGTGKNAPMWKAKARELMGKCQNAVPAWIMPMGKAVESLNPGQNRFDIIIIDEASQSDISALAVLYMGRKLIVVGDDKQVSPMAIGVEVDQMESLKQMYINGKIPNAHLYDAKTSLYDLASTTFQPLMLREHFRCMPDIIGFCNQLSYDNKIKPLRDSSSCALKPSVISYRAAQNAKRQGKVNRGEAEAIIRLIQECLEQEMYQDKSFGIISMLGDEQVKLIQSLLYETLEPQVISEHRILVGNSANFQGDERDIIFLSLVDSAEGNGPLRMMNFGADDAIRKRYNVAVSRARDQIWVVHSLNPYRDLKKGDIRRILLEYAAEYGEVRREEEIYALDSAERIPKLGNIDTEAGAILGMEGTAIDTEESVKSTSGMEGAEPDMEKEAKAASGMEGVALEASEEVKATSGIEGAVGMGEEAKAASGMESAAVDASEEAKTASNRRDTAQVTLPDAKLKKQGHQKSSTEGATQFEIEFAEELRKEGYNVTMQYQIGAYHLDMVAEADNHLVAIECDGETIYNSEGKLREDMERQAILERAGWRFIRLRGTEYYLDKEKTKRRVIEEMGF